jgi:hypothetical protein
MVGMLDQGMFIACSTTGCIQGELHLSLFKAFSHSDVRGCGEVADRGESTLVPGACPHKTDEAASSQLVDTDLA